VLLVMVNYSMTIAIVLEADESLGKKRERRNDWLSSLCNLKRKSTLFAKFQQTYSFLLIFIPFQDLSAFPRFFIGPKMSFLLPKVIYLEWLFFRRFPLDWNLESHQPCGLDTCTPSSDFAARHRCLQGLCHPFLSG
jgi:hypothetical protein